MFLRISPHSVQMQENARKMQTRRTPNMNYQNLLAKDLKDQFIGKNMKQKEMIRIQLMNLDIFSNQTLSGLIDCLS